MTPHMAFRRRRDRWGKTHGFVHDSALEYFKRACEP